MRRIAGRCVRAEPRRRVGKFVRGLPADRPAEELLAIAEWAGEATPDGMQHLLERAKWDADAVQDDLRECVVDHLGAEQTALIVDETGDGKKGQATVGARRQYTGTAGRIENAQVTVYLVYATERGHGAVDRELSLPPIWSEDPQRRRAAGPEPDTTRFATKTQPAAAMIERFCETGHTVGWVTLGRGLWRRWRRPRSGPDAGRAPDRVCHGGLVPHRSSHGRWEVPCRFTGSQGAAHPLAANVHRRRRERAAPLRPGRHRPATGGRRGRLRLLIRRNRTTGELAYYRCFSPHPVPIGTLVRVAGMRWRIEETPGQEPLGRRSGLHTSALVPPTAYPLGNPR
ncbi:transposase [Streptomyces sp. NPDC006385]|uniref:IS701 family transposase n=1 Tax=Streptomyces sp. NPDC006385 TaxID=3156761 RepID=UPI0033B0ABC2